MSTLRDKKLAELTDEMAETGRTLWWAGLGAVAQAEEEGRGWFDTFVERGRKVEKQQFKAIDRTLSATGKRVRALSERVQTKVEGGLQSTIERLGLVTRSDLDALAGRLEALDRKVDQVAR